MDKSFNINSKNIHTIAYLVIFIFLSLIRCPLFSQERAHDLRFANIDRYARFTPPEFERSVEMLARYLMDGAENDAEKVRAFYVWIANNISYDTKSYFRRQYPDQSPQAVLKRRTAVCIGYANLFKRFCDIANFPCIEISGFSKGYGTNPAIIPEENNHIWNAVQVNDQWRLIDAAWASGYINKKRQFVKRFSAFYFFPDPDEFIFTHFPSNYRYQLLLIPKSKEEFLDPLIRASEWFEYGLKAVSPRKSMIIDDKPFTIRIKTPDNVDLAVKLTQSLQTFDDSYTFVQRRDSISEISVNFPRNDVYMLKIFVKYKADSGLFNYAGEYWLDIRNMKRSAGVFPIPFKTFYDQNGYLYDPLKIIERQKGDKIIDISVPAADKIAFERNKRWIYFEKSADGIFKGRIPNLSEDIIVYALFPGETKFQALLKFTDR